MMPNVSSKLALGILAVAAIAMSGCSSADATLEYNGKQTGSHNVSFTCGKEGTVNGDGDLGSGGTITVQLKDGAAQTLILPTEYKGSFTMTPQKVTGQAGTWVLSGTRGGQFVGSYSFFLNC